MGLFLHEYDFDIVDNVGRVNMDDDELNWSPSSNEENTIGVHWHKDANLEVVPTWHALTYLCIILGCSWDVPQINMCNKHSCDTNIESKGDGVIDIHEDALVISYLQASEILVKLSFKIMTRLCIGQTV
jgi:hypothetical protein